MTRPCLACDGTGLLALAEDDGLYPVRLLHRGRDHSGIYVQVQAVGSPFSIRIHPEALSKCAACSGSGRISERIPASDAIADAETPRRVPRRAWIEGVRRMSTPPVSIRVSSDEVAHELASLLATSHPTSLDRERAERLDWILRAYREAGSVGVVAFVRGELEERKRASEEATTDLATGISTYLQAEAKELQRIEAQVCPECGYAAGVHDPLTCSWAAPR